MLRALGLPEPRIWVETLSVSVARGLVESSDAVWVAPLALAKVTRVPRSTFSVAGLKAKPLIWTVLAALAVPVAASKSATVKTKNLSRCIGVVMAGIRP